MNILSALHDLEHNQEIGVYALTPDGKKATKEAVDLIRQSVTKFSNRLAEDATTFANELKADLDRLQQLGSRAQELNRQMEGSSALDNGAVDEFFDIESEANLLARKVMDKEARIDAMLADLDDPVSALDRLEKKYPVIGKSYLQAFGR